MEVSNLTHSFKLILIDIPKYWIYSICQLIFIHARPYVSSVFKLKSQVNLLSFN
jgi:hypothetical protein